MNLDQIKRLAALAVETEDKTLADIALKAIAGLVIEAPAPVAKKPNIDEMTTYGVAVRSLIGTWKNSGRTGLLNTTELIKHVLSHMPNEELDLLFPGFTKAPDGNMRGHYIEEGIPTINRGLHSEEIVLHKGFGRKYLLRRKTVMGI